MINILNWIIIVYFLVLWLGYIVFFISSLQSIFQKFRESEDNNVINIFQEGRCLPVTVIMPVYNYATKVSKAIDAVLQSDYPSVGLIVVNDGSNDHTLNHLREVYALKPITPAFKNIIETATIKTIYKSKIYSHFYVIDKAHYDKISSGADAINAALNICKTPLFMTVDSDTLLDTNTISNMVYSYLTHPHCVAIGGNIYIPEESSNHRIIKRRIPKNINLGVQVIEYLRSFFYGHEGWSRIGGAMCHSGACTMFERRAVMEVGGYDRDNYSYDSDIVMKLHDWMRKNKYPYHVAYASSAIAWASQPRGLIDFWNQRNRWQRGLWRSFFKHIHMMFNPKYGKTGMVGFPYYFLFEILGPVIEGIAYIIFFVLLLTQGMHFIQLFWFILMAWSFIFLMTLSCILLNYLTYQEYALKIDMLNLLLLTIAEVLFFRPFRALGSVWATLQFTWNRLLGKCL
ncbi:MAG: glycosyltransferase family 2 protein [Gammaproteobacteria bacterium]|nr:glycosyltransferase family 2 protein [Gammaproteobacteria bacterium]